MWEESGNNGVKILDQKHHNVSWYIGPSIYKDTRSSSKNSHQVFQYLTIQLSTNYNNFQQDSYIKTKKYQSTIPTKKLFIIMSPKINRTIQAMIDRPDQLIKKLKQLRENQHE